MQYYGQAYMCALLKFSACY